MCYKRIISECHTEAGDCAPLEWNEHSEILRHASILLFLLATVLLANRLNAQNLTLEGQTGGFITPTAYVVYSAKGQIFSHPAVGYHFVNANSVIGDVHTFSIAEGFANRAELGYTRSVHWTGTARCSAACGTTRG